MSSWFKDTFGFDEMRLKYDEVRDQFRLEDNDCILVSLANGRRFNIGKFETPSVEELDMRLQELELELCVQENNEHVLTFENISGNVEALHLCPVHRNSVFQAASQFNCLEMPHPNKTPNHGITNYITDSTQGPACAMACPAGTLYRNYFVNISGQGGTNGKQLDCLYEAGLVLENDTENYWSMYNGYALPSKKDSIKNLKDRIINGDVSRDEARSKVKVGVQWSTEVKNSDHCVTQVYCSALPVGYSKVENPLDFEPFASLVLDAIYDATFAIAAILSHKYNKRVNVFLTKVGGGVFRNRHEWIIKAIQKSLSKYSKYRLNVFLVHHGIPDQLYTDLLPSIDGSLGC